jgi:NADPH-dependent 2,4-dienoyl-CoA reductase/sulfur reductase-like enzyme
MARVVIVGVSVAGVRTAQALRLQGFAGEITLIGEESHHPYDKPPLSKGSLASDAPDDPPALLSVEALEQLDVALHLGVRATGVDPSSRVVHTVTGTHEYDHLVIATGVSPRTLPGSRRHGVRTVRTLDDAVFLRTQLDSKPRVVVVGAGFIGAEFAAAASSQGCQVTILEAQETPMAHLLGERVGATLAALHTLHGVNLRTGVRFSSFLGDSDVEGVALADGDVLPADLVVIGIGASPATGWLADSGLPIENGVECGSDLRVVGHPEIFAAGDVARWPHPHYGEPIRVEHWTNANEHGAMVAAAITGAPAPRAQVPYVWSDQYGHRIQIVGLPSRGTLAHLAGQGPEDLVAIYVDEAQKVVGGVVVDDPRAFMKLRRAVTKQTDFSDLEPALSVPAQA